MDPATITAIAAAVSSLWQSLDSVGKARTHRRKLLRELTRQEARAIDEQKVAQGAGERRIESNILRNRTASEARDPFMESAATAGAQQQAFGQARRAQQAGLGVSAAAGAMRQARAQGILARESVRLKRQDSYNQLIAQQLGQLGDLTQAGFRTRAELRAKFSGMRAELDAAPPGGDALGGALAGLSSTATAMMGAEGETLSLEDKVLEAAASNSKVVDAQLLSDFGPSVNTTTASPITNKFDWEGLDTFGGGAQFDWDLFKLSNNITGFGSSPSW